MSTISQLSATNRPATVTAASVGLMLFNLFALLAMPMIAGGFEPVIFGIGSTFIVLRVIAAFGLWRCRKWGALLGFVATLLDVLLALPGFVDGTVQSGMALLALGVAAGIISLVLIVLPSSRRAYV